ncbi:HAMP domain-containing protein, partial [Kribbella antibiotica]
MRIGPRSLRARITASIALLVMVVVALTGLIIAVRIDHRDRTDLDNQLSSRAAKLRGDVSKLLNQGDGHPGDEYGGLLVGSQSLVRLIHDGQVDARGDQPTVDLPIPAADGYVTLEVGDQTWRSLTQTLADGNRLQVLQDLGPVEERLTANAQLVTVIAIASTAAAGSGVWLVITVLLSPLQRLRAGAAGIRSMDEGQRLPAESGTREVADLSAALNDMLAQLQTSTQSTRRFTADAGHELRTPLTTLGVNLETLYRNPELSADQRQQILTATLAEHTRITALLEGLQTLARGDAGALPARTNVDITDLLEESVRRARHRYPATTFRLTVDHMRPPTLAGWQAGLRTAIDNLLDNAALHGRPQGRVDVMLHRDNHQAFLTIDDDGP